MKQSSLFSFFSPTPKATSTQESPSASASNVTPKSSTTVEKKKQTNGIGTPKSSSSSNANGTPKSTNTNGHGRQVQRQRKRNESPAEDNDEEKETKAKRMKKSSPTPESLPQKKRVRLVIQSDSEEEEGQNGVKPKRSRKVDDDDSEYEPDGDIDADADEEEVVEEDEVDEESDASMNSASSNETPRASKKKGKKSAPSSANRFLQFSSPKNQNSTKNNGNSSMNAQPSTSYNNSNGDVDHGTETNCDGKFAHLKLDWLKPDKIRDIKKLRPDNENYNPRTLFVPEGFLKSCTPGLKQWWDMKSKNFDTILFFKVGKFYELYHMDAVIGVKELGIIFMKDEKAHCGFPEISYSRYSSVLIEKGYKVARIEQTETKEMKDERRKKSKGNDNVVLREICQKTSKGVRIPSFLDPNTSTAFSPESEFIYALAQRNVNGKIEFGVCFIDTTIGTFNIGQFVDDRHLSRLRTLFSHHSPVQILTEKSKVGKDVERLLNNMIGVRKEALTKDSEFMGSNKTLKYLAERDYFKDKNGGINWPENLRSMLCEKDSLGLTPGENCELAWKSFGAVIWYLDDCLVADDLLTLKQFEIYTPLDNNLAQSENDNIDLNESLTEFNKQRFMVLDSMTLKNLDVIEGQQNLLSLLDKCITLFGKRMLQNWVCMPLTIPAEINERLDAVEVLMKNKSVLKEKICPDLKSLPDLERLLLKVHSLGSIHRAKDHPDSRAVFFDDKIYSKRKIYDLVSIINGFKMCQKIMSVFENLCNDGDSKLLNKMIAEFPNLDDLLNYFNNAFNHKSALNDGKIIPISGADADYDEAFQNILDIEKDAHDYLRNLSNKFGCKVAYFGSDKKRYQIEIPEKIKVPTSFEISSGKKGFKRYTSDESKEILARMMRAETERDEIVKDLTRRIFARFDGSREIWSKAVGIIGMLDVLMSLAAFSSSQETMCRPKVSKFSKTPFILIENGRHPCLALENYIPNSIQLGNNGSFLLLSGPNMGGKSTLMRQVGLLTILSHIGTYVPATKCELTSIDRIFTRLGANDNIGDGESTFFVEMSETSSILRHSTLNSLVLMDELGRGTSTYDGTSIAYAVSKRLADRGCRTLFSTHYHTLVEAVSDFPSIKLGHMACLVENENDEDPTEEKITFLYKMVKGPCPKSYGFNAAKLAGMNKDLILVAYRKAKELEAEVEKVKKFREIFRSKGLLST